MVTCAAATVTVIAVIGMQTTVWSRKDRYNIAKKQRTVDELYEAIGDAAFRKVYRMDVASFGDYINFCLDLTVSKEGKESHSKRRYNKELEIEYDVEMDGWGWKVQYCF